MSDSEIHLGSGDLEKACSHSEPCHCAQSKENWGWWLNETRPKPMSLKDSLREIRKDIKGTDPNVWLHVLLLALPFAWAAHFEIEKWGHRKTFVLCFIAMIPLQKIFDWGGEKIGPYLEKDAEDLVVITFSNLIEAVLAVILLIKCELRFLQSTLIGVVLLHLLLVPGASFFIQGAKVHEQKLHPQYNSLNHSLSMVGVLGVLVPTLFFAALDRGDPVAGLPSAFVPLVSDPVRHYILHMSRGISIILLVVYAVSRVYRHNVLHSLMNKHNDARRTKMAKRQRRRLRVGDRASAGGATSSSTARRMSGAQSESADVELSSQDSSQALNPWLCVFVLVIAVGLMIPTAEFLVSSIEGVQATSGIQIEWFGLILLPIVSFSADGTVVIWKTFAYLFRKYYAELRRTSKTNLKYKRSPDAPFSHSGARSGGPDVSSNSIQATSDPDIRQVHSRGRSASQATAVNMQGAQEPKHSPTMEHHHKEKEKSPFEAEFAHWRPFDLSIQFMLMWMPLLVLLGWWTDRPFHLLFDYYEVGLLLGACFLVNYVTVDSKTNMSEGLTMIAFYAIIATATWFYPGQPQVASMLNCPGTVAEATTGSDGES